MAGVLVLLVVAAAACAAHHSASAGPVERLYRRRVDAVWSLSDGKSAAVTADGWKCIISDSLAQRLHSGDQLECAWR